MNKLVKIKLPPPLLKKDLVLFNAFSKRRSTRYFQYSNLSDQELSNLLWCACGVNEIKEGSENPYFFTNPTASRHNEISIYVFREDGAFLYDPISHSLYKVYEEDVRKKISKLIFVKKSSVSLCIVADAAKMIHYEDTNKINYYSVMDAGYVSQNIYLYCAAKELATCACGIIEREFISEIIGKPDIRILLIHPIGSLKKD